VAISARTGEGIDELLQVLGDRLRALTAVVELLIPYDRGDVLAAVHREGEVVSTMHDDGGVRVRARLADASAGRLVEFVVVPAN
jgi:GTP-binding protein HflX